MKISNAYCPNYNNFLYAPSNRTNFAGLTKPMQKQVFIDPKVYQNYFIPFSVNFGKNIAGELPEEFIEAFKKTSSTDEIKLKINTLLNTFSAAANVLSEAEIKGKRIAGNFCVKDFMDKDTGILHTPGQAYYFSEDYYGVNSLTDEEIKPFLNSASKILTCGFKETGLISDKGTINVSYSGYGSYGNVYNIEFLDNNGSKIFHDKTLKVYKNPDIEKEMAREFAKRIVDYYKTLSFEEYLAPLIRQYYNDKIRSYPDLSFDEAKSLFIQKFRNLYKKYYDEAKSVSVDEFVEKYYTMDKSIPYHGLFAEANRAIFLKHKFPDIKNSNYVEPFFFDLKNGFALFETSDTELLKPKFELPLDEAGLKNQDLLLNEDNVVFDRVVDYGGIVPVDESKMYYP